MDTLSLSVLTDVIMNAGYVFGFRERKNHCVVSESRMKIAHEAFTFMQGTGLEKMLEYYQIDYSADSIRSAFTELWRKKNA